MLVSCICPTYGRPPRHQHLLEEAIESFIRQDWPEKELIVVNDCPEQMLELKDPRPDVRIVNMPYRLPSLGDKYNAAVKASYGKYICSWDDDDISLSRRLSFSVEQIGDCHYHNPRRYWFLDGAGLHHEHPSGYAHNASMYSVAAWKTVGGYRAVSGCQDAYMDRALRELGPIVETPELPPSKWSYIYRWGVSPCHLSAFPDANRESKTYYDNMTKRETKPGKYVLRPHYDQDYEAMCRDHICEHGLK